MPAGRYLHNREFVSTTRRPACQGFLLRGRANPATPAILPKPKRPHAPSLRRDYNRTTRTGPSSPARPHAPSLRRYHKTTRSGPSSSGRSSSFATSAFKPIVQATSRQGRGGHSGLLPTTIMKFVHDCGVWPKWRCPRNSMTSTDPPRQQKKQHDIATWHTSLLPRETLPKCVGERLQRRRQLQLRYAFSQRAVRLACVIAPSLPLMHPIPQPEPPGAPEWV